MKSVYLNHSRQAERTHWSSWLLLAFGLLVLGGSLIALQRIKASNAGLQTQLAVHSARSKEIVPRNLSLGRDKDAATVNSAISTIVTPWTSLLKGLENAAAEDSVKMLTFEPNVKTRSLRLKLVATDKEGMWAYLQRLNQQIVLKDIHLISNETISLNGQPAVEFLVEATWPI